MSRCATAKGLVMGCCGLLVLAAGGCGGESGREEETSTIDGVVTYKGTAVPPGSRLVLEDRSKGIRMSFDVAAEGKFSVGDTSQLPAGTYKVGVMPPAKPAADGADYDKMMSSASPIPAKAEEKDDFPVPPDLRDPQKSGKTVDVAAGSQTLEIKLE